MKKFGIIFKIYGWLIGLFFFLGTFVYLTSSIFTSILFFISAILLIPPTQKFVKNTLLKNAKFNLTKGINIGIITVSIFGGFLVAPKLADKKENQQVAKADKTPEEIAKDKADEEARVKKEQEDKANTAKLAEEQKKKDEAQKLEDQKPENIVAKMPSTIFKKDGYSAELKKDIAVLNYDTDKGTFWDDKAILESMLSDLVIFGRQAKNLNVVNNIEIYYKAKLVDTFGKSSNGNLMWVTISKSDFEVYNFDNLKGKNFYNSISKTAGIWILPSTRSKIDFSKVSVTF